jgi:hypothetical protein
MGNVGEQAKPSPAADQGCLQLKACSLVRCVARKGEYRGDSETATRKRMHRGRARARAESRGTKEGLTLTRIPRSCAAYQAIDSEMYHCVPGGL